MYDDKKIKNVKLEFHISEAWTNKWDFTVCLKNKKTNKILNLF